APVAGRPVSTNLLTSEELGRVPGAAFVPAPPAFVLFPGAATWRGAPAPGPVALFAAGARLPAGREAAAWPPAGREAPPAGREFPAEGVSPPPERAPPPPPPPPPPP